MAAMMVSTLSTEGELRPVPVEQLASKNCLVCGRAYRYSHNARRHERNAHSYDRYTNKIEANAALPNPRPSIYKPNNYYEGKEGMKFNSKPLHMMNHSYSAKNRLMPDYQNRSGRPEILKSLLTAQTHEGASDSEVPHYDSPDMSEPDPTQYQVEAIVSVPDTYSDSNLSEDEENEPRRPESRSEEEIDSDVEVGDCSQLDINKIIGIEQDAEEVEEEVTYEAIDDEVSNNVEVENVVEEQVIEENIEVEVENMDDNVMYTEVKDSVDVTKQDDETHDEEEDMVAPLVPIVEMNDSLQDDNMDDESDMDDMSPENRLTIVENSFEQTQTITSSQKAFLTNYRDLIEQINTMKCKCCDRNFPRRKAVIQHLQKNGSKIPKHTCYTCVIPFTHIGALLSHMRYNCCNDTWKLIYKEGGIPDSMVVEESPSPDVQDYGNEEGSKSQYRDVLNARSYSCKLCSAKFHLKQFVMKHVLDVHENSEQQVALTCFNCKNTFTESRLWKKHVRNGECTVDICCDLCTEKFLTMQDFNEHAITAHADQFQHQNQPNENQTRNTDGRSTNCPLCKKSLSNYHNLVKHLKMVHNEDKPHICQFCFSKYKHVTELQHHINVEHSERMNGDDSEVDYGKEEVTGYNYSCTECSAVFDSVEGWTEHQINVHHHIAHECDQCDKKFWDEVELEEHRNMHLKGKPFKCMLCSNSYSSSKNLSEHINHMHQESISDKYDSQFYCDICIRSFKSRQAFSNHMRIHAKVPTTNRRPGDMKRSSDPQYRSPTHLPRPPPQLTMKSVKVGHQAPYSCDICGKGFLHKKNIWKHKKMLHPDVVSKSKENIGSGKSKGASTEEDDYVNDDQNTHLSTPQFDSFVSTGYDQPDNSGSESALPYQCDLCDKKFAVKSSIWKHKRVKHGVINPQQELTAKPEVMKPSVESDINRTSCTICKINFTDKKAYYRHRKNAHKVKVCKICGITLNTSMELFEHLQTAHAKELLGYNESQGKPQKNYRTVDVNNATDEDDMEDDVRHPNNHKEKRYSCETCGQGFNELMAIQNHVCFQRMAVSETYDCEICNKSYTSISALKSHRGWHLRSPDGRAAFSNSGLWMPQNKVTNKVSKHEVVELARPKAPVQHKEISPLHIKRKLPPDVQVTVLKKPKISDEVTVEPVAPRLEHPTAARPVSEDRYCEVCNKAFTKKAAYQRHMDEVHKPNGVFCPICNKSFTRKSTLLVHMRKHDTGDISEPPDPDDSDDDSNYDGGRLQSLRCDICNVQCESLNSLNHHKMKQHGENDRQFKQQTNSRYQGQSNDGRVIEEGVIKEFKCSLCEEEWDTEHEVWNHHHFQCTVCRMSFSQHQYLVTHTQTLHSNKEHMFFSCGKCNRSFMNKQSLQRHVDTFH